MTLFRCQHCGQVLYFENRQCQNCSLRLGYLPAETVLSALEPSDSLWRALAVTEGRYRFCANADYDACNWLISAESPDTFCLACRYNRTIPDITNNRNLQRWRKFELAKHRLFYTLIKLGLAPGLAADETFGLTFNLLADSPQAPRVITGHSNGMIAVNLIEADDIEREKVRSEMGETYRTLLGHLRHESGHYYWDRLVNVGGQLDLFRSLFGDERMDYQQALRHYYANGPANDWTQNYISGYASAHPWEDFAETWAHYLHIVDTLEMAFAFGVHLRSGPSVESELNPAVGFDPHRAGSMTRLIDAWLPLTFAVNSIVRCMGEPDFYPFILSPPAIHKMGFVHNLVHRDFAG